MVRKKHAHILDLGASIVGSFTDHLKRSRSLPPPFNSHSSSADDCNIGCSSSECGEQPSDSTNEGKQVNSDKTMSDTIPI
jgi:hypothetical protein